MPNIRIQTEKCAGEYIYLLTQPIDYPREDGPDSVDIKSILQAIPKAKSNSSITRCFFEKERAELFATHLPKNERRGSFYAFFYPQLYFSEAAVISVKLQTDFIFGIRDSGLTGGEEIYELEYYDIDISTFEINQMMEQSPENIKIYFGGKERTYSKEDLTETRSYCLIS